MKKDQEVADERRMIIQALVSADSRNNWIIFVVVIVSGFVIYANVALFTDMIQSVATNINTVVNNTSKNMSLLTQVLIEDQRTGSITLNQAVDNQTRAFVAASDNQTDAFIIAVGNFTDIISDYSIQNDKNLKSIKDLVSDIYNNSLVENQISNTSP